MVTIIELQSIVTDELSSALIQELIYNATNTFGVDTDDVSFGTVYTSTGIINLSVPSENTTEFMNFFESQLLEELGVHHNELVLSLNPDGTISYSITTEDFYRLEDVENQIMEPSTIANLQKEMAKSYPSVEITTIEPTDEILAEIQMILDVSNAENNAHVVSEDYKVILETNGFVVKTEGNVDD